MTKLALACAWHCRQVVTRFCGATIDAGFDAGWGTKLRPLLREVARRLDLDFFGVDCNIDPSGQVTLFEANACMLILKNTAKSPNMWDAPIARITKSVEALMAAPERWRDFRRFKGKT